MTQFIATNFKTERQAVRSRTLMTQLLMTQQKIWMSKRALRSPRLLSLEFSREQPKAITHFHGPWSRSLEVLLSGFTLFVKEGYIHSAGVTAKPGYGPSL